MKKLLIGVLLSVTFLTGCGNNEVIGIYDVPKTDAVMVDNDVVFEYGGRTFTAKGQAPQFKSDEGDFIKVLIYKNGKILIKE